MSMLTPLTQVHITIGPERHKAMEKMIAELEVGLGYAKQDVIPEGKDTDYMAPEVIEASERAKAFIETYGEIDRLFKVMLSNDIVKIEDDRILEKLRCSEYVDLNTEEKA